MNGELNMKRSKKQLGILGASAHAFLRSRILIVLLAIVLFPAIAVAAAGGNAPKGNPRLDSLQIEIWPEFDRPAALVILKGELPASAALPADVSLRIPASSGGPQAVAFAKSGSNDLLNLKYEREDSKNFVTLKFKLPDRVFHIEFYDPLSTGTPQRNYTYVWPGDLATDRLAVMVQEPAGTLDLTATPALGTTATGQDGLRYRSSQLGALEAGKQLPIKIAYTKTSSQTSKEMLQPQADGSLPALSTGPTLSTGQGTSTGDAPSGWVLGLSVALPLVIAVIAIFFLWRRRRALATVDVQGTGKFCSKCGAALK